EFEAPNGGRVQKRSDGGANPGTAIERGNKKQKLDREPWNSAQRAGSPETDGRGEASEDGVCASSKDERNHAGNDSRVPGGRQSDSPGQCRGQVLCYQQYLPASGRSAGSRRHG